jgi:hypothetical protein
MALTFRLWRQFPVEVLFIELLTELFPIKHSIDVLALEVLKDRADIFEEAVDD